MVNAIRKPGLVAFYLIIFFFLAAFLYADATIYIEPAQIAVSANNEEFDIQVMVSDVIDLHNVNFDLALDSNALEVLTITEGSFLSSAGSTIFLTDDSNPALVNVTCALLGTDPGPDGSGLLATFHMKVKNVGLLPAALGLQDVVLRDHNNVDIAFGTQNGSVVYFNAVIYVSPPETTVSANNEEFDIEIRVSDIIDLHNVNFDLALDSNALEVLTITEGSFLSSVGTTIFLKDMSNPALVNVACALLGTDPGADGSGLLATFHMKVKNVGLLPASLTLQNVVLRDHNNQNIPFQTQNGSVVTAVNHPPVLDPIGDKSVDENQNLSFTVTASDPDSGDTVTLSATGLPAGASFTPGTGAFSWTPTYEQSGTHDVTFTATDDGTPNLDDSETITITVNNVNRPPVLDPIGDKSVNENEDLSFTVTASDPDSGDTVTLSATGLPAGASFIPATGAFNWTPTYEQSGTHDVTFTATDDGTPNLDDSETITITVNNVNRPPVLDPIGDKSIDESQNLSFIVTASDPDAGDAVTLSAMGLPAGASFTPATGAFNWTPTSDQVGEHAVTFAATDDGSPNLSDSETITITVTAVFSQGLASGYNLISVPFVGTGIADAESLAQAIQNCTAVWKWDAATQNWIGHPLGGPNNFAVEPGGAYLASVTAEGVFVCTGLWATPSFALKTGYDLISLPKAKEHLATAEELVQDISNCTAIWKWNASTQSWVGHPPGGPNNFAVEVALQPTVSGRQRGKTAIRIL